MWSHTLCSAFISEANQTVPSLPQPWYSGMMPTGSLVEIVLASRLRD